MEWQSTPYLLLLFMAALSSFLWALYGVRAIRDDARKRYVQAFIVLCLAVTVWSATYAVQLALPTLEAKLLAYKLLHVGGVMVPPAWLAFAIAYTGRSEWLTPATVGGLVVIPLALLMTLPTNPYSLALTGATVETHGALTVLVTDNGPVYLLHLAYGFVAIIGGACLIGLHAIRSPARIRRQSVLLVAGAVVPLVLNVQNVLSIPPLGTTGVNLTPVSLSLSTVLFGVAVFRHRMLDLTPVAWNTVVAQLGDGVLVLDERERVVELNAAAESLVGSRDDVLGVAATSLLPEYDRVDGESPFLVTLSDASGEERILRVTRSPLAKYGETHGWVVLAHDVTVAERQRRELKRQNEQLDKFAKIVSHDLRNPLTVIDAYTDLAEETGEREHFETVHDAVASMYTFLEELLQLAQQGETVTAFRPVPLDVVANAVALGVADAHLEVAVTTDAVVLADENRLRQVLDNLFRNARDHTDGDVTIRVGELPDGFYVEDDGEGISPDARSDVFTVGYSTRAEGSGFGLTIIRDIVDAHGWSIDVTEGELGGARFEITGVDFADRE